MVSSPRSRPGRRRSWLGVQGTLTLAFFGVALLIACLVAAVLYQVAREQVLADLRQKLRDVVSVAAHSVDGDLHARITPDSGMASSDYRALKATLRQIRGGVEGARYVYTLRRDHEGAIRFVVDAEEDPGNIVALYQPYANPSPLLLASFDTMTGPIVETEAYEDAWGAWLTGYAPFFTSDGRRSGILGVDIPATALIAHQHQVLRSFLMVLAGVIPVILLAGAWLGRTFARPLLALEAGARRVETGELGVQLAIRRSDEIGHLAASFNRMTAALAKSRDDLNGAMLKYRQIFDNASEGIYQTSLSGRVLAANPALVAMLGYDSLEQVQAEIQSVGEQVYARPTDRDHLLEQVRTLGRVEGLETVLCRRDGSQFWAVLTMHVGASEEGGRVLEGMVIDITERRQREQAERDREAARVASEAKSAFLATMSHEIRTPLNAILGLTDLVLRTDLDERQRDYLTKVTIASRSLLAVINDILDFSKIEAGRLDLEETTFSLHDIMANLTEMFAFRAHEKEIELIVSLDKDLPCDLIGDPVRLGQILINLTGNAIKFTDHGEVVVRASREEPPAEASPEDEVWIHFTVQDTGIGIPADRVEAVFESFSQADGSTTRRHGGTGLGLAICRRLAELMGGRAWAESVLGEGSTFHVVAGLRRQTGHATRTPRTPMDLRGLKVLVVEDNATSREILVHQIESFQMIATPCASGEEALAILGTPERSFDLVLMDWKMPGLNGLETARRIRTDLDLRRTPVVCMISAYAREDLMQQSERSFLDAFLHKPVNQSFLFDTIMTLFGHQEATVAGPQALPAADPDAPVPDLGGRRVLLVEDIEINRLVALEWLHSANLTVEVAENGRIAVERVLAEPFDAVLMDIQMPEMDGLEATRRIRAARPDGYPPIIAMTAHALKGDLERCLAVGMNDYISKPIDPARLFATLSRWVTGEGQGESALASDAVTMSPPAPAASVEPPPPASKPGSAAPGEKSGFADLLAAPVPGLAVAEGLARANNNRKLYLTLLRRVRDDHLDTARRAEAEAAAGHLDDARRLVHSLKGIAGNVGAGPLHVAAQAAETWLVETGALDPAAPVWRGFVEALETLGAGLKAALVEESSGAGPAAGPNAEENGAPADGSPASAVDEPALAARLSELEHCLDDDVARAEQLLADLAPLVRARFGAGTVDTIRGFVEDFDLDAAIAEIRRLRKDLGTDDRE
ncbi:hybrid sensor histidine kinase/response regulator [Pararhodospirillum oryzae]|uniref:Sensory/regulatory protein RpfC n=1 Tax=Pararhodospirillum oryzae TaxID=478448 RepID=A0A512H9C4_9PROT|nr:response regulator [Pararhodospirillum oryzae]GEO82044.1 hypothetical protein ROR02_21750 [Pararhodospirillum oryzae]